MPSAHSRRRIARNLLLGLGGVGLVALVYLLQPGPDVRHKASLGTAYAAMLYFAASLSLGPLNVLDRKSVV